MNPIATKSVSKLVMQPSFRAAGQTHVEWQTFEKPENMRQMCGQYAKLNRGCKCLSKKPIKTTKIGVQLPRYINSYQRV